MGQDREQRMKYTSIKAADLRLYTKALLVSSVALCGLAACESPLADSAADRNWSNYASAVLARGTADGTLASLPVNSPTMNDGVKEYPRIGPNDPNATQAAGTQAIIPAGDAPGTVSPVSTTQPETMGTNEPRVMLSLQDAIARAMKNSLAIKVEAYNPGINEARITEAEAVFDPALFVNSDWGYTDEPTPIGSSSGNGTTLNNTAGLRSKLASGGTAQISAGGLYKDATAIHNLDYGSGYTSNVAASLSQPLLRGFGSDVNRSNIYLAQRDRRISLAKFRQQVTDQVFQIEQAYHTLVFRNVLVEVQQRLLDATKDTLTKIEARLEVDADRTQVAQARAQYQKTLANLIRARTDVRDASDRLKALINDPALDLRSNMLLVPSDRPVDEPIAFNVAEQIDTALRQRPEMAQARLGIEKADINVNVARNDLLPKADMTVNVQSNGGVDNGFDQAFNGAVSETRYMDYSAGLRFEMPIGNRAADAALRRRQLERRQALTQMLQTAQGVILDVKVAIRDLLTSYQEIRARREARIAAGEQLDAIIKKEEVVQLTPEFLNLKLQSQQLVADSETLEIQAAVNYNIALAKLQQVKGTLLEYNRIALDSRPPEDQDKGKIWFMGKSYELK